MIVQCDKCKTKFRIADEKVTEAGVKVRCSRCAHVFMVQREPAQAASGSSTGDLDRAFAGIGLGGPPTGEAQPTVSTAIPTPLTSSLPSFPDQLGGARPLAARQAEQAALRQGMIGSSAGRIEINDTFAPSAPPMSIPMQPTGMYPPPSLVPSAATTKDAMIALGFSVPPAEQGVPLSPEVAFDEESTAQFTAASLLPPQSPQKKAGGLAFPDLGNGERFPAPASISTFDELFGKEPPTQVGDRRGFESRTSPSNPQMQQLQELEKQISNPHMNAMQRSPTSDNMSALLSNPAMASMEAQRSSPDVFGANPKSNPLLQAMKSNPALAALAAAEGVGPGDLTNPFFPPPTGIPGLGTSTNLQSILQNQAPNGNGMGGGLSSSDLGDIPGLMPNAAASDDPFAGLDLDAAKYSGGDLGEDSQAETRAVLPDAATPAKPLARIDLGRAAVPSQFETNMATTRVATSLLSDKEKTADVGQLAGAAQARVLWPTFVGLALGLVLTIAGVFGPAGGDLTKFGPEDLIALFTQPVSEPIATSLGDIEPRNAQVTLYPGKDGKNLLVVAGEAYNDGDEPIAGIEAVAMVKNGSEVLEQREAWVGITLAEDALSSIAGAAELELAIQQAVAAAQVPIETQAIKPGESVPFMVVFPDPPVDLEHRAFQVEFRRGSVSARRAQ